MNREKSVKNVSSTNKTQLVKCQRHKCWARNLLTVTIKRPVSAAAGLQLASKVCNAAAMLC